MHSNLMMNGSRRIALAALVSLAGLAPLRADEEQDLIAVLESKADPVQKCEACKRLRLIGTARCVQAVAPLLLEMRVSQAARYALEAIPGEAAGGALRRALAGAPTLLKVGVLDSLGWRRDVEAVPLIVPLIADADPAVAAAAAASLGRIRGPNAEAALVAGREQTRAAVRVAVSEALLRCADEHLRADERAAAAALYRSLFVPDESEAVRTAAYAGMVRAAEDGGFALIVSALEGSDSAAQAAALAMAKTLTHPAATRTFATLIARSSVPMQVALIALLEARGDVAARPALIAAARSPDGSVRVAGLRALGGLGDASAVAGLAEAATSGDVTAQQTARESLARLRGAGVREALVAQLAATPPAVQVELVRALTARRETAAVPALLELARTDPGSGRQAALQALGSLADGSHVQPLVALLREAKDARARDDVRRVFEALVQRAAETGRLDVAPIAQGMAAGDLETRQALLQVGAWFADESLRTALRAAANDPDDRIREAAARALCDARDPALLPDVIAVARQASDTRLRALALEGAVRLATEESAPLSIAQRTDALIEVFALARRLAEKRLVLAGLARVPDRATLKLAEQACADAEVRAEAEQASLQIAEQLGPVAFESVEEVLTRLSDEATSATVQRKARALLKALDSGWLYAGPYRQAGKECQELFEIAFAPEQARTGEVRWRRAPGSADLARVGEVDFSGLVGGDHGVMYAKTRVYLPLAQAVTFAIGSDDGIKLWVNGELVHANNAVRGLTPDQDRAKGQLRAGWNDLFVKVTQHTVGCGFTFRIVSEEGGAIPGLRFEALGGGG